MVIAREAAQMQRYIPQWEALAATATEPNVFYEHWMLLPALNHYGEDGQQVAFVVEHLGGGGPPVLLGVLPLEICPGFRGIPLACVRQWKYPHCYLAHPLVAPGREADFWSAFFGWLRQSDLTGPILEFKTLPADGPLFQSLLAFTFAAHLPLHVDELYSRAMLRLENGSGEDYLHAHMGGDHRRSYARKKRLLGEKAPLQVCTLAPGDNLQQWLDDFLQVEGSGWKRQAATAMACRPADRAFFTEISQAALERHRLMMMSLKLGGRPVAVHHGIHAGSGSFALKIGYDETLGQYSPGMLLEMEVIRALHRDRPCLWVDCCSAPGSLVMKRVWKQQRMIASVICPTGKHGGRLLVAALPVAQYLRRRVRSLWSRSSAIPA